MRKAKASRWNRALKKLSTEEEAKLRAILAEPTQKDVTTIKLRAQIASKIRAAEQLGDPNVRLSIFREGVELLPDATYRNNLATELLARGEIIEGNRWRQEAINAVTNDFSRAFQIGNFAWDLYSQNKDADAWAAIEKSEQLLKTLNPKQESQYLQVARTNASLNRIKSYLYGRKGKEQAAIDAVNTAIGYSRQAAKIASQLKSGLDKNYVYQDLTVGLNRKTLRPHGGKKIKSC